MPLTLSDVVPGTVDFGPIAEKPDQMSGCYIGQGVVMTRLWSGHSMFVTGGDMIFTPHLIRIGVNEPHNSRILCSLVGPGSVVVDIGANVGYFTILSAWRAWPDGRVWAFEPNPNSYRLLADNITANGFPAIVERRQLALSDSSGAAALHVFPGYEATATIRDVPDAFIDLTRRETGREPHRIDVATVRLDDEMAGVPEVHVMKIDAEGHEPAVLRGAMGLIRRSPRLAIVMEFVPAILDGQDARAMLSAMRGEGFAAYRILADATLDPQPDDERLMAIPFSDLLLVRPHG